jgi:hypothetical protein
MIDRHAMFKSAHEIISALLLVCPYLAWAGNVVEVEGAAVVRDGELGRARVEARQNALRQAAMQKNASVQSQFATDAEGNIVDSLQVRSNAQVRSSEILGEQVDGDLLTVQMRAELGKAEGRCGFSAAAYRKKIAAVYFPITSPGQVLVNDYYGYERGIPTQLLKLLAVTGSFLTRDATDVSLYTDPIQAPTVTGTMANSEPALSRLGHERGIQFVISGVVRDLSYSLYSDWFSSMLGSPPKPYQRNIGIDFYIHDVLSGELLASHHYVRYARGEGVVPAKPVPFGSAQFYNNDFGRQFKSILEEEMMEIFRLLRCRPFVMKVLKQIDGKLYLDAGANTLIQEGDVVTVYRPDVRGSVFGTEGKLTQYGWPTTTLRVIAVFPGYSIAETETKTGIINIADGEYLRAW